MLVREERTGWRDSLLSERHRLWDWNCCAVDLDLVLVEYASATAAAIIEYKAVGAKPVDSEHPTYRSLRSLADCSQIPFLIVVYDNINWTFVVTPANEFARTFVTKTTTYNEQEFVSLQYEMRGLEASTELLATLNSFKPVPPTARKIIVPPNPTAPKRKSLTVCEVQRIPPNPY